MGLLPASLLPPTIAPRVNNLQVRRLLRLGIILRWVAIAFAGLAGVIASRPVPALFYLMLLAVVYNFGLMAALGRISDAAAPRLALLATIADQFFDLAFIAIYSSSVPNADQIGPYMPGLIEAVAYFGLAGAALSTGIFFVSTALLDIGSWYAGRPVVSPTWLIETTLIVALIAAVLVPTYRILTSPVEATEVVPELRLPKREQEVLRLVAEGYSNTMIASRLNLSDNTVKSYVESLLTHLNARNRAEAVAAASRLKLL